jgi:hypothetical protein
MKTFSFWAMALGVLFARSASGQAIAHWAFDASALECDSGYARVGGLGVSESWVQGLGAGKALSVKGFAPQGTESGGRGLWMEANTAGMDSVWLSGALRGSSTSSRWWHIQASVDSGSTWFVAWQPDSGWGPFDVFVPFTAPLAGVAGHSSVWLRLVSVFSPVAFSHFGGSFGPHEAYQGMREQPTTSSQNYSTAGTWRWDNLRLNGLESPPTIWNGLSWSLGAPVAGVNAVVAAPYSGPGFTCDVLRVAKGVALEVFAGGALDVRGRALVDGEVVLRAGASGQAQMRVAAAGGGVVRTERFWPSVGWQQLSSPLAEGVQGLSGADSLGLYSWNADSGEYRAPGQGLSARGQGFYVQGSGLVSVRGGLPRIPWSQWSLGYADVPNPVSTVHSTSVTDGWNLLGNPFACGLDFTQVERMGVDAAYSVWDPALNAGLGGYAYYSPSGGSLGPVIPPMQGFWVRAQGPGAQLMARQRGVLNSPPPSPRVAITLAVPDRNWTEVVYLDPREDAGTGFDADRDAMARQSPTGIQWVAATETVDAAAKSWNPQTSLTLVSWSDSSRSAAVSAVGHTRALWLLGADGQRVRLDQGPAAVQLDGSQSWTLLAESLGGAEAQPMAWRTGPGWLWVPDAVQLEVLNVLGQVVLTPTGTAHDPIPHGLAEGVYVLRVRSVKGWESHKILLKS